MPTPEARRARMAHLYEVLAGSDTVEDFLKDLARVAVDHIDSRVSCGLTAQMEGRAVTIASSDDAAFELDQVQQTSGEGPCVEAIATGALVEINEPGDLAKWPAWRRTALKHGLHQAISLPMIARGEVIGAMNLYSTGGVPFTHEDREAAHTFATHATGTLVVAMRLSQLADLTGHLESALSSRAVIDQAKGVLMTKNRCTADEAFAILVKTSQNENVKVRDLAEQVLSQVSRPNATPMPVPRNLDR